jgi:hypothetical protein
MDVGLDAGYESPGKGVGGGCHNSSGHMIINSNFPSLKEMTDHAHTLSLTASWYLNSDACKGANETLVGETYRQDSHDAVFYGFDGVKFDSEGGGPSHNITAWAVALNATGKQMMIENCLNKNPAWMHPGADPSYCPMNFYRSGPDNSPSFHGGLMHVYTWAVPFLNSVTPSVFTSLPPSSRPGCFAYPDMLGIGAPIKGSSAWTKARLQGCADMSMAEERTLFANWAIVSSPLVLGIDSRDDSVVMKYLPIVGNKHALAINQDWAGYPGQLLKQSNTSVERYTPIGAVCEENSTTNLPEWLVYTKPLNTNGGGVAALFINLSDAPVSFELTVTELIAAGAPHECDFSVVDVWTGNQLQAIVSTINPFKTGPVASHDSVFVEFLTPTKR